MKLRVIVLLLLLFSGLGFAWDTLVRTDSVTRGQYWSQVCDSQGSHNVATITFDQFLGTNVVWTPTVRQPGESWDNVYIWQPNQGNTANNFIYKVKLTLADNASRDSLNAFEFEVQVVRNYQKYNMAWQIRKTSTGVSYWTFDFANKKWVFTGITGPPTDLPVGLPVEFIAVYEMNAYGPHHLGISVNGKYFQIDIQRNWVSTSSGDYTNFAFQFDGSNKVETIKANVDAVLVTK